MKKYVSSKLISLVFGILVICFAIGFYVFSWVEPSGDAPIGNVPAPLNTSGNPQIKVGGLILGTGLEDDGSALGIMNGRVGIGTLTPTEALDLGSGNFITTGRLAINTTINANYGINILLNGAKKGINYINTLVNNGESGYGFYNTLSTGGGIGNGSSRDVTGMRNDIIVNTETVSSEYIQGIGVHNNITVSNLTGYGIGVKNVITGSGVGSHSRGTESLITVTGSDAQGLGILGIANAVSVASSQKLWGGRFLAGPDSAGDEAYGIGIDNNTAFVVNDPTQNQIGLYIDWSIAGTDANNKRWAIYSASTEKSYFGGDVAIGTNDPQARLEIETSTTEGRQALTIDQNDADKSFIDFQGTSSASYNDNISTNQGDGEPSGPRSPISEDGWAFEGMIQIEINGDKRWIPYYSEDAC